MPQTRQRKSRAGSSAMAETTAESLTPSKLSIEYQPALMEAQTSASSERSAKISCTASYNYTLNHVLPTQEPRKVDLCLPPTAILNYPAWDIEKLGELCLSSSGADDYDDDDYAPPYHGITDLKFAATDASTEMVCVNEPPAIVTIMFSDPNTYQHSIYITDDSTWRVQSQAGSEPVKIIVSCQFHCSFPHVGVNGLSSPTGNVNPALKLSLLEAGSTSGDLNLICKDGTTIPAHSAVLASVPYFESKLKEDWSGTGWNLNNRLDLNLPTPVSQQVLETFLKHVYGDLGASRQLDPSDVSAMQDLFSLAEACGVLPLCSAVDRIARVTPESAHSWLEWLSQEHVAETSRLHNKVKSAVMTKFTDASFWEGLSADKLLALESVVKPTDSTEPAEPKEPENPKKQKKPRKA